jgi:monomeric sarcosine oxidase
MPGNPAAGVAHWNAAVLTVAYDIAVIGAGVFGSWTAWHLARAGKSVLLLEAWAPGHSRASSGGESRIIRMGYGVNELYTGMAMNSLAQWQSLFQETGQSLFHRTGVLWVAREGDAYSAATRSTLAKAGVPMEILPGAEMARRYPQMHIAGSDSYGIFEPESGALMARRAVAAVVQDAISHGVEYANEFVAPPAGERRLASLRTVSGQAISAREMVFACGPWLPKLFPGALGMRICPTRQEVFFFAPPAGDKRFTAALLPVWIDFNDPRRPYGFPDLEGRGIKLALDRHGPGFDPDSDDRRISAESAAEAQSVMAERFPALRGATLAEFRVCQYENTSSGDFLIDRHPDFDNVWLVGGGSGHGFKHGPAVGEYVCARILNRGAVEPRFSLGKF